MEERRDENPETAAITGGVPAAAEPSPLTRGRRSAAEGSTWIFILLGIVLLIVALVADSTGQERTGIAVAGATLIALGVLSLTRVLGPATIAALGFLASILLTIVAFSSDDFRYPQWFLLVAGAAAFISSFASLAAAKRSAQGPDEPQAGVENV